MDGMNGERTRLRASDQTQAESFFRVMASKHLTIDQMADIMGHMGKMLVAYAEDIDAKRMPQ
jgi:hypothetical protein